MQNKKEKTKEKAFANINTNSFLVIVVLLVCVMIITGVLTYLIPQGEYLRDEAGMIIDGSYVKGEIEGIAIWRIITAPIRVYLSSDALTVIMISIFLVIMSGIFNLLEKTGGIRVIISRTTKKFSNRKKLVICITTLIFMLFGSFFGMFEELVTLLPLVIVFMLSMGFDTLTGLGVCMMSACFGFSAAITNPFSVGIVVKLAGTHVFDGVWLRIIFFVMVFSSVCAFLLLHARKIERDPTKSLTYEIDREKLKNIDFSSNEETSKDDKLFRVFIIFFIVQFIALVLIACVRSISGLAIPILSLTFLIGGIVSGMCVLDKKKDVFKYIGKGSLAMLPAILMIALATSVKLIMEEGGILDTVMFYVITLLDGKSKFLCIILIYFLILFLQIMIGSSSAKIMLIMPIILPIATTLGLSPAIIILTYCIADGFTDVFLPTNPVLLIGLSMANVSYGKWVKWTWKFQLLIFIATVILLLFAVKIGY